MICFPLPATTLVWKRCSGPYSCRAAAEVSNLFVEAGMNADLALAVYTTLPVPSTTSTPARPGAGPTAASRARTFAGSAAMSSLATGSTGAGRPGWAEDDAAGLPDADDVARGSGDFAESAGSDGSGKDLGSAGWALVPPAGRPPTSTPGPSTATLTRAKNPLSRPKTSPATASSTTEATTTLLRRTAPPPITHAGRSRLSPDGPEPGDGQTRRAGRIENVPEIGGKP